MVLNGEFMFVLQFCDMQGGRATKLLWKLDSGSHDLQPLNYFHVLIARWAHGQCQILMYDGIVECSHFGDLALFLASGRGGDFTRIFPLVWHNIKSVCSNSKLSKFSLFVPISCSKFLLIFLLVASVKRDVKCYLLRHLVCDLPYEVFVLIFWEVFWLKLNYYENLATIHLSWVQVNKQLYFVPAMMHYILKVYTWQVECNVSTLSYKMSNMMLKRNMHKLHLPSVWWYCVFMSGRKVMFFSHKLLLCPKASLKCLDKSLELISFSRQWGWRANKVIQEGSIMIFVWIVFNFVYSVSTAPLQMTLC